mmetsp:Transcript_42372/g.101965  ORF Transcript_42372/g.101965 Transcript_42372/m.101965 type:complete len:204 (-) Transcript_42372:16-627(-)
MGKVARRPPVAAVSCCMILAQHGLGVARRWYRQRSINSSPRKLLLAMGKGARRSPVAAVSCCMILAQHRLGVVRRWYRCSRRSTSKHVLYGAGPKLSVIVGVRTNRHAELRPRARHNRSEVSLAVRKSTEPAFQAVPPMQVAMANLFLVAPKHQHTPPSCPPNLERRREAAHKHAKVRFRDSPIRAHKLQQRITITFASKPSL